MNKNTHRIGEALRSLSERPCEIIAGTVVAGSVDEGALTVSVQPTGDGATVIENVLLNTIEASSLGLVLIPTDGSHVVIGSIDGPGEWTVLKANDLTKATVKIGSTSVNVAADNIVIKNGETKLELGSAAFKINTASETLYQLLNDLITALTTLTVGIPTGVSTVPSNVATFTTLLTRLNNLLNP